jgi:hypothetical protein
MRWTAAIICLTAAAVLAGCDSTAETTPRRSDETPPVWTMFQETRSSWALPAGDEAGVRYRLIEAPRFVELDSAAGVLVTNPDHPMRLARYRVRFAVVTDRGSSREHRVIVQVMPVL